MSGEPGKRARPAALRIGRLAFVGFQVLCLTLAIYLVLQINEARVGGIEGAPTIVGLWMFALGVAWVIGSLLLSIPMLRKRFEQRHG